MYILRRALLFTLINRVISILLNNSFLFYSLLVLMFPYKLPEDSDIVTLMLQKIETIHATEPQLEQIVVERFFGDAH